jgi:hypothetical protein
MPRVRSHRIAVLLTAASLLSGCAQSYYARGTGWIAADSVSVPANGLSVLKLVSRQGPVRFTAGPSDSIRIVLRIGNAVGAMGTTRECRSDRENRIRVDRSQPTLSVRTEQALDDQCVAEWLVTLPAGMTVDAEVAAGTMTVDGTTGGVRLEAQAGDIEVGVAAGPVSARTGTGSIALIYTSDAYGGVEARTQVGKVELWVGGRSLSHQRRPGSGDELRLDGKPEGAVRLSVNVGGIRMRLGRVP